ncbi:MAG: class I SAM-dependent methyltransferase [Leptonema sp. (in: bacteria)]
MPKDRFSKQSKKYLKFRPKYPKNLYDIIYNVLENNHNPFETAWDCGTGNGQAALELAKRFKIVYATDLSKKQIEYATKKENIFYRIEPAEKTSLIDHSIDLTVVAQALHWFNFNEFFKEVQRVSKKSGMLAVWCYSTCKFEDQNTNSIFSSFYRETLGPYWDKERMLVESGYKEIHFPFTKILDTILNYEISFTRERFQGYISTWSSVQNFIRKNQKDPTLIFTNQIREIWSREEKKKVTFPIYLKIFQID